MENIAPTHKYPSPVSTPLLISMVGIATTALAIVLYHIVVVKYYSRRPQHTTTTTPPHPSAAHDSLGVDEKILEAIPILAYSAQNHELFRVDQNECAVCLGELEETEMVRLLPNCKHAFHIPCVDQWLMGHTTCPICRSSIVVQVFPVVVNQETDRPQHPIQYSQENNSTGGEHFLLRHCASLMLPTERRPGCSAAGLKRSMSMDQSFLVINMERERERVRSSPSSSSTSSLFSSLKVGLRSNRGHQSVGHLDRVSSKLLRSLSRRIAMGGTSNNGVLLPY